jgi:hypothetical protein
VGALACVRLLHAQRRALAATRFDGNTGDATVISFWVTDQGAFGIQNYQEHRGAAIRERFAVFTYEAIGHEVVLPAGAQVFAAVDHLSPAQRLAVERIWDAHASVAPAAPRLNDPRRVLLRFDLLRHLYGQGLNSFNVYPAKHPDDVRRFPVFVRHRSRHDGPATNLLNSRDDLLRVLRALRLRGRNLDEYMIVEFCDASASDGLFRKYAAFKVGDRIIPCHLFTSSAWCVKSVQNHPTEASVHEQLVYLRGNPHEAWLRDVFQVAGIDYGRIDYGVSNGVPQAWEINVNPTIGRAAGQSRHTGQPPHIRKPLDECRDLFHEQLKGAFVALDGRAVAGEVRVIISDGLVQRLRAEGVQVRRRRQMTQWLANLYERPLLGKPARAVFSLFPRR